MRLVGWGGRNNEWKGGTGSVVRGKRNGGLRSMVECELTREEMIDGGEITFIKTRGEKERDKPWVENIRSSLLSRCSKDTKYWCSILQNSLKGIL